MSEAQEDDPLQIAKRLNDGATYEVQNNAYDPPHEYTVEVDLDDKPQSCTCPHHHFRRARCKHMVYVAEYLEENDD